MVSGLRTGMSLASDRHVIARDHGFAIPSSTAGGVGLLGVEFVVTCGESGCRITLQVGSTKIQCHVGKVCGYMREMHHISQLIVPEIDFHLSA